MKEETFKKALLICPYTDMEHSEYRSKELVQLCKSAYYEVAKVDVFFVKQLNAKTYFGMGKVEDIKAEINEFNANIAIIDAPLTGSQLRNLSDEWSVEVADRTKIILDIFASRAKSKEGILEVELAKLKYSLPRLQVKHEEGGRSGFRGNSESKTELERRKVREEIAKVEKEIEELSKQRQTTRKMRLNRTKSVALVGYTNAGKSTLMNVITKANTYADDRLFATLDVLAKKVWDEGVEYVLIDTVGFVSNLPHELMHAFSATLEETLDADVLVIVVDSADSHKYDQIATVEHEINRLQIPADRIILAYNKIDKLSEDEKNDLKHFPYATTIISAKSNLYIDRLKNIIREKLSKQSY